MPVFALLNRHIGRLSLLLWLLLALLAVSQAQRPELASCIDRPTAIEGEFYVDNIRWCVEHIIHDPDLEPLSFTALEAAPDGTLYATRPLAGKVMVLRDTDGDTLPDAMRTFADGLSFPNGLAFHEGNLYVAGGSMLYRISPAGEVTVLVNDLPVSTGFGTGGIAIGADGRLYLAEGAPCSLCEFDETERGAILSMNLAGADRQVFASGFPQSS